MSASESVRDHLAKPYRQGEAMGGLIKRGVASTVVDQAPGFRHRPAERLGKATGSEMLARAGQRVDVVGAVLSLIIVSVIAYVGLDVVAEIEANTDIATEDNNPENRSALGNASNSLDGGVDGAFSLMGVVFLVILLSVIIGLFLGLRG